MTLSLITATRVWKMPYPDTRGNRQACFYCDDVYLFYLECLLESSEKTNCSIHHGYVLITNHVHLLPLNVNQPVAYQRFRVSGVAGLVNTNHFHKAHFSISLNQ